MIKAAKGFAGRSVPDRPFEAAPSCEDGGKSFATACQGVLKRFGRAEGI
jgi:hypothetical protein